MDLPTWIQGALRSEQNPLARTFWRCVEAQHVVSTLPLVDSLEEQALLEEILEVTKPAVPPECAGLHYLYMTPFRYGNYPAGSRFRRAGRTAGVCYASEAPQTAVVETAFHLLLFYRESPATPFPTRASEHTAFDVPVHTGSAIDLIAEPFSELRALWLHVSDYTACQQLETQARAGKVALIRYTSVRDPDARANAAILECSAFAAGEPSRTQTWRLLFNSKGVHAICEFHSDAFTLSPEHWKHDPRLRDFAWSRPS